MRESVVRLKLIDGKGEILECEPADDLFKAAIGGIGAVGIIVDVISIIKGKRILNDIVLKNYDIVYVPRSRIDTIAEFSQVLFDDIIGPPLNLILRGWQIKALSTQLQLIEGPR